VLFDSVFGLLIERKRYADVIAGAGDITARLDGVFRIYRAMIMTPQKDDELRAYAKKSTAEKCAGYYEALVGAGNLADAHAVRDRVLAWDRSADVYSVLVAHAARAGGHAEVEAMLALAKRGLPAAGFKRVEEAAR
jgi:hypothetical protein